MDALNGMLAGQASIWAQPDGPNTQPQYLGCHEMSDLEDPEGDVNLAYCPDPARSGGFRVTGSWQGAPGGPPTTTLTVPVGKTGDYLEHWPCPGNLILNKIDCGRRDQFTNRARAFALYRAYRTGRTYQNMAARSPEDEGESMLEVPFAAEDVLYLYGLSAARQSIAALGNLKAIDFLDDAQCGGDCGPARGVGQIGVAAGEPLAGSAADFASLYITQDGGGTWTAAAADPFGAGEMISAVQVYSVARGVVRILVARFQELIQEPPTVAYSDDLGATWTVVESATSTAAMCRVTAACRPGSVQHLVGHHQRLRVQVRGWRCHVVCARGRHHQRHVAGVLCSVHQPAGGVHRRLGGFPRGHPGWRAVLDGDQHAD